MSAFTLIVGIVSHGEAELLAKSASEAGASGGTILLGRGISANGFLQTLALGDTTKELIFIHERAEKKSSLLQAMKTACSEKRKNFGVLFTIDSSLLLKMGKVQEGETSMTSETENKLITVIANKGYAEDIMAAVRKAGAGGGTVISARGTAKPGDEKFFGMQIVPEKEMIFLVVDSKNAHAVLDALHSLSCLSQPGSGIAFSIPVNDFDVLGKK